MAKERKSRREIITESVLRSKKEVLTYVENLNDNDPADGFNVRTIAGLVNTLKYADPFTRVINVPLTSSSELVQKAAFIARNIDGVVLSIQNETDRLRSGGDFESAINAMQEQKSLTESIVKSIETLNKLINQQLEKGVGTRFQLRQYNKEKAENSIEKIAELLKAKKTNAEIAETLKIDLNALKEVKGESEKIVIRESLDAIKKQVDSRKTFADIAVEMNVDVNRLRSIAAENEIKEFNEKDFIVASLSEIGKLLAAGKTFADIATELNVNVSRLESISKRNNVWVLPEQKNESAPKEKIQEEVKVKDEPAAKKATVKKEEVA